MKSIEIKSPNPTPIPLYSYTKVFLAGSIEMGTAENWQAKVVNDLPNNVMFLNPRRDDWDASWKQEYNNPEFYSQVTWELDMLNKADIIAMYFDPNTKSLISLIELGLYANSGKLIVCCPEGFWRKGNVDIICSEYGIKLFDNYESWLTELKRNIG